MKKLVLLSLLLAVMFAIAWWDAVRPDKQFVSGSGNSGPGLTVQRIPKDSPEFRLFTLALEDELARLYAAEKLEIPDGSIHIREEIELIDKTNKKRTFVASFNENFADPVCLVDITALTDATKFFEQAKSAAQKIVSEYKSKFKKFKG